MTDPAAPTDLLPPAALQTLVDEQRTRTAYRGLLLHAHAELDTERELEAAEEDRPEEDLLSLRAQLTAQKADTHAQAHRLAATARASRTHRAQLATALAAAAREEVTRRPLRAAQRRTPHDGTLPSGPPLTIDPAVVTRTQREEHNAVAAALLHPSPPDTRGSLGTTLDVLAGEVEETYREMHRHAMLTVRYVRQDVPMLAAHHAGLSDAARLAHERALRLANRDHARATSGRPYQAQDTYHVTLPDHDNPDLALDQTFLFHLDLRWTASGDALTVDADSARAAEALSGILVGTGWQNLAAWVQAMHARVVLGEGRAGRPEDHMHLIWGRNGDTLSLRPEISARYPGLVAALECLRCCLRLA